MKPELRRHRIAYAILIGGLVFSVALFLALWPNAWGQRAVAIGLALFYFFWGVMTHFKADHITRRIVYEYAGVAVLAVLILILITL